MHILGFRHRLGRVNARCKFVGADWDRIIQRGGNLSSYVLIGDVAYPCRPWMLSPFKGHKDGLSGEEYHWNFVQSSMRVCAERAFGMLKDKWRILLKMIDMHFKNVPKLVSTCIVSQNICIIFGEIKKNEWVQEATNDVYSGFIVGRVSGGSSKEKLVVVNHALHSLADINEVSEKPWNTWNKKPPENIKSQWPLEARFPKN